MVRNRRQEVAQEFIRWRHGALVNASMLISFGMQKGVHFTLDQAQRTLRSMCARQVPGVYHCGVKPNSGRAKQLDLI